MKKETISSVLKDIRKVLVIIKPILEEIKEQNKPIITGGEEVKKSSIPSDFTWKIEMKKEWTAKYIFNECKKLFPIWIYDKEELNKITSDRKGDYTVYFRDRVEADEELKSKSADDLSREGIKGITLEEILVLEIDYFNKTGKHLDIENVTLCSGSRVSDGRVPYVHFRGDEVSVYWCSSSDADSCVRARSVAV
jgi:hypothetical protein